MKTAVEAFDVRAPGSRERGLGSGVVGDAVLNRKHHGGDEQAVYAVAREELDHWSDELGRSLANGMFGENITTVGCDVDGAVIGERWQVGTAVLQVTSPRTPCRTFADLISEDRWIARFSERGRTGAYLSVVEPGRLSVGDAISVVDRPSHGLTVTDVFRAFEGDAELATRVLEARCLPPRFDATLRRSQSR